MLPEILEGFLYRVAGQITLTVILAGLVILVLLCFLGAAVSGRKV